MSNAVHKQALEDLAFIAKRFHGLLALADYLAGVESPADLEANIRRLKGESSTLIPNMRKQAEAEAERNMKGAVEAAERKAKSIVKDAEGERATIINQAQAKANELLAKARKDGEELLRKYQAAHQAANAALR